VFKKKEKKEKKEKKSFRNGFIIMRKS